MLMVFPLTVNGFTTPSFYSVPLLTRVEVAAPRWLYLFFKVRSGRCYASTMLLRMA